MPIKLEYATKDELPDTFAELYTEKDGKFVLTGVEGLKTQQDIDRIHGSLVKERNDHKTLKTTYSFLEGQDLAIVQDRLSKYEELEAAAAGKIPEDKLNSLVEARLTGKLAPLERDRKALADKVTAYEAETTGLKGAILTRDINDSVRTSALAAKVVDTALEDVLLIAGNVFTKTEDGRIVTKDELAGVPGGLDAAAWLNEMKEKRPHWWPASEGAGGKGGNRENGGSANPWRADNWNMTEQTKIVREKGIEAATRLAQAAGSSVGSVRPPVKK